MRFRFVVLVDGFTVGAMAQVIWGYSWTLWIFLFAWAAISAFAKTFDDYRAERTAKT